MIWHIKINLIISLPSEPGGRGAGLRKKRRSTLFVLKPFFHLENLHIWCRSGGGVDDDEDLARPTAVLQSQLSAIWLYSPSVRSSLDTFQKSSLHTFVSNSNLFCIYVITSSFLMNYIDKKLAILIKFFCSLAQLPHCVQMLLIVSLVCLKNYHF